MNCTQSPTVLITHGQPCDASCKHYIYNTYSIHIYSIIYIYVYMTRHEGCPCVINTVGD